MAMHMQDASSPLRLMELHAVDLSDDDSNAPSFPTSPSTATTVSSRSSSRTAHESKSDAAHASKNSKSAHAKELELGVLEEPQSQQQLAQHLTSYVLISWL